MISKINLEMALHLLWIFQNIWEVYDRKKKSQRNNIWNGSRLVTFAVLDNQFPMFHFLNTSLPYRGLWLLAEKYYKQSEERELFSISKYQ